MKKNVIIFFQDDESAFQKVICKMLTFYSNIALTIKVKRLFCRKMLLDKNVRHFIQAPLC